VWDNRPILNVYFDDLELKEQELQLQKARENMQAQKTEMNI
jgi:hypothetical protein